MKKKSRVDGPRSRVDRPNRPHRNWRARPGNEAEQWEEDDVDDEVPPDLHASDIVQALRSITLYRRKLEELHRKMDYWREAYPDFDGHWHQFISVGGLTGTDYAHWANCIFRGRRTRVKKHLRLVVNNPPQRFRLLGRYRLKKSRSKK